MQGPVSYTHLTYSAQNYSDDIPEEVKHRRLDELMAVQQEISADLTHAKIGKEFKVTVSGRFHPNLQDLPQICVPGGYLPLLH